MAEDAFCGGLCFVKQCRKPFSITLTSMDPMDRHSVIYFPLSSPDASIQLLRIFRGKGSSIITGQLEAFPLDPVNCPAFIASDRSSRSLA